MIEPRTRDTTGAGSDRWQELMYRFVKETKPSFVVETGHADGLSSEWIIKAMDENGFGRIASIESFCHQSFEHPRLWFCHGYSYDKMPEIFLREMCWDIFIHDSDHNVGCQTFEYELAWHLVRPGGWIFTDDYDWGTPPHQAWNYFVQQYEIKDVQIMGTLKMFQKPETAPPPISDRHWLAERIEWAKRMSNAACDWYGCERQFPNL